MMPKHKYEMTYCNDSWDKGLATINWDLAVNLFFKPGIGEAQARKAAKHLWNIADCRAFGHGQVKRQDKHIVRACFLERSAENYHYHCAVQLPTGYANAELFCLGLQAHWEALWQAGKHGRFEEIISAWAWCHYISKGERRHADTFCNVTSRF